MCKDRSHKLQTIKWAEPERLFTRMLALPRRKSSFLLPSILLEEMAVAGCSSEGSSFEREEGGNWLCARNNTRSFMQASGSAAIFWLLGVTASTLSVLGSSARVMLKHGQPMEKNVSPFVSLKQCQCTQQLAWHLIDCGLMIHPSGAVCLKSAIAGSLRCELCAGKGIGRPTGPCSQSPLLCCNREHFKLSG